MATLSVDKSNFQKEVLEHKGVVFVDFYAEWCGPCKMTEPTINDLANETANVKFVKVNVDENPELTAPYSIFSIPTFVIFKEGKIINQFVGAMSKEGFLAEINKAMG